MGKRVKKRNSIPALEDGSLVRDAFLVFGKPEIKKPEIDEVVDSMKRGWLGTGPKVSKFEDEVKKYLGCKYAMALNSATAGLHLSLIACGVGRGDEVITTPMTFAATANVIEHVGARPVFADIEKRTMNINPVEIEKKITKKTKVIIPVHMAGRPCDMDRIMKIAKRNKLIVVEDAAHAFGASYRGRKIGSIGDLTAFSFYATKNLVTGEGGMLTTNNGKYAEVIKIMALHGMDKDAWKRYSDEGFKHYLVTHAGYKYNMMDLQAAMGIHQLRRFDKNQERRKEIWEMYTKGLQGLPLETPLDPEPNTKHAYHLYAILVDLDKLKVDRDTIQSALHAENIGIGIHFIALHLHPYYRNKYGFQRGDFPNAEYVSDRTISIPLGSNLTNGDIKDVLRAITKVLNYYTDNPHKGKPKRLPRATG